MRSTWGKYGDRYQLLNLLYAFESTLPASRHPSPDKTLDILPMLLGLPPDSDFESVKVDYLHFAALKNDRTGRFADYVVKFRDDVKRSKEFHYEATTWHTILATSCLRVLITRQLW